MDDVALNQAQFEKLLKLFMPELWVTYSYLRKHKVNARVLPLVISSISNLCNQSGNGKIQIYIQNKQITSVNPEIFHITKIDALTG